MRTCGACGADLLEKERQRRRSLWGFSAVQPADSKAIAATQELAPIPSGRKAVGGIIGSE